MHYYSSLSPTIFSELKYLWRHCFLLASSSVLLYINTDSRLLELESHVSNLEDRFPSNTICAEYVIISSLVLSVYKNKGKCKSWKGTCNGELFKTYERGSEKGWWRRECHYYYHGDKQRVADSTVKKGETNVKEKWSSIGYPWCVTLAFWAQVHKHNKRKQA